MRCVLQHTTAQSLQSEFYAFALRQLIKNPDIESVYKLWQVCRMCCVRAHV
jgi:hypothetical protein